MSAKQFVVPTREIRRLEARAVTILLKAQGLAADVNRLFGFESSISDAVEDVLCTAETLTDGLHRMPEIIKAGGHP